MIMKKCKTPHITRMRRFALPLEYSWNASILTEDGLCALGDGATNFN